MSSNAVKSKYKVGKVKAPMLKKTAHYNPKRPKKENIQIKKESKLQLQKQEPFIAPDKLGTWNTILDKTPSDIASKRIKLPERQHKVTHETITPSRRQFLFLNLSDDALLKYFSGQNPPWTRLFQSELSLKNGKGYFENLPIVLKQKRKQIIKECYFNPGKPTSQYQIHGYLQKRFANITRKQVASTLHTLETYQRLRTRRLPKKVTGRIETFTPGFLSCDTFYPSQKYGWPKGTIVLSCMDMWSRFVGCYILGDKESATAAIGFEHFIQQFMKHSSTRPRKLLLDRGTELFALDAVMKKYSNEKQPVWRSLTGQPCNQIENVNGNVQRKAQIYLEAGVISDYSDCLWLICNSLNNEKRKDRMGYTPIELLSMNKTMRAQVNANYKFRTTFGADDDIVEIGEYVRVLQLNRKEQISEKTKGFPAHWSRAVHQVTKRISIIQNKGRHKYFLKNLETKQQLTGSRFRHEILRLKIKNLDEIDRSVPHIRIDKVPRKKYYVPATGSDGDYNPEDDM